MEIHKNISKIKIDPITNVSNLPLTPVNFKVAFPILSGFSAKAKII